MKPRSYALESIWRSALKEFTRQKPSFFVTSLVAPLALWLIVSLLTRFEAAQLRRDFIPVLTLMPIAVFAWLSLGRAQKRHSRSGRTWRYLTLVQRVYYCGALLCVSAYFMRAGLGYVELYTDLPGWLPVALLALFAASILFGSIWAPRSLPRSAEDDALAVSREARWLPWVMAFQSTLVGVGVFLGAWFMHDEVSWEGLLVLGLSELVAVTVVFFTVLAVFRFLVLSLHPIPPTVLGEFHLKPEVGSTALE